MPPLGRAMKRMLPLAMLALAGPALAGEPLATDDASILERSVCQFEA